MWTGEGRGRERGGAGASKDASIPLRRGNKIITGDRGREEPGWEMGEGGEKGGKIRYGAGTGEKPREPGE